MLYQLNNCYLLLGSNQGDRIKFLLEAKAHLEKLIGPVSKASAYYQTAAWGNTDQPDFLNQVLEIKTDLSPRLLLKIILEIEIKLGRKRTVKNAARVIDIDILYYNNLVIDEHGLKIPHPEIQNRRFALIPLAEIAPDVVHPILKRTSAQLLAECTDELPVIKYHR